MTIQIITNGTVGIRSGNRVTPKTAADGPFSTDKAVEKMLVAEGVAEYFDAKAAASGAAGAQNTEPPKYDKMRKPELLALAAERGLYSGDPDDITIKKLAELLKLSDEGASDGQTPPDPTQNPGNGDAAGTGDESGQSGEIAENTGDSGAETGENGADGDENGASGEDDGQSGDAEDQTGDPDATPPVIDASGVVE